MVKKLSIRERKALDNLVANGGNPTRAMLDAGYAPATAHNPKKLLDRVQRSPESKEFLDKVYNAADMHLKNMSDDKKVKKMAPNASAYVYDVLVKIHRLLGGKSTENIAVIPILPPDSLKK